MIQKAWNLISFLKKLNLKKFITSFQVFLETKKWRPQGDSNPRRRRERAVSWARLDDGDFSGKHHNYKRKVSREGIEPSTTWLKVKCSTNWASGP